MHETAEIVIIGAGVNGASLAFHLAQMGIQNIIVLEKQVVAAGATGLSSGLVRMHYANEVEAQLALSSYRYFRHWADIVGGDCGFVETGFIRTVAPHNTEKLRANVRMLQKLGVQTHLVTAEDLRELAPGTRTDDIVLAAYEPHSGYADPAAAATSFLAAARRQGVTLRQGVAVLDILHQHGHVTGVQTTQGIIEAGIIVCATGAWTTKLLERLKLDFPVWNVRHEVALLRRPPQAQQPHMVYIDGVLDAYYRPDSPGLTLVGSGPMEPGADPDSFEHSAHDSFVASVAEKISSRMPVMEDAEYIRGWAGVFAVSADLHPLIGSLPGYENLYAIFGCNGTGFKVAPAIGKAVAEQIMGVSTPAIALASLRPARYMEQEFISDPYSYSDRPQEHTEPPQ